MNREKQAQRLDSIRSGVYGGRPNMFDVDNQVALAAGSMALRREDAAKSKAQRLVEQYRRLVKDYATGKSGDTEWSLMTRAMREFVASMAETGLDDEEPEEVSGELDLTQEIEITREELMDEFKKIEEEENVKTNLDHCFVVGDR